jgi:hypothetical protein
MSLDKKIISEIERYWKINQYISEQTEALPPAPPTPAVDDTATETPVAGITSEPTPEPIDVDSDPDVTKIDDSGESMEKENQPSGTEELDVTELVDSQKTIETKQEDYFNQLFSQLTNLESKLSEMDNLMNKLNTIENKIEKYREKTPQEKLELRSYDSYPFNQKLSDFFDDKKVEMEKTGKRDYVLTSDDVTDINANDIKNSFLPNGEDE